MKNIFLIVADMMHINVYTILFHKYKIIYNINKKKYLVECIYTLHCFLKLMRMLTATLGHQYFALNGSYINKVYVVFA